MLCFHSVEISSSVHCRTQPIVTVHNSLGYSSFIQFEWKYKSKYETERGRKLKTEYKSSTSTRKIFNIFQWLLCQNQKYYLRRIQASKVTKWFIPILQWSYKDGKDYLFAERNTHFKTCLISAWREAYDQGRHIWLQKQTNK